ncbi:serine/threonine-protein phosphatase, partial [Isoptericola sp. QY 916]|nr:serine/threonine-protein phosphatase [Isoptericola sp. QY 916]
MSGTVPPPPPGSDGRPSTVPSSVPPAVPPTSPATGVRRVASAYQRPVGADPVAEVPLQQVTAPAPATPPAGAATVHAPVPP